MWEFALGVVLGFAIGFTILAVLTVGGDDR